MAGVLLIMSAAFLPETLRKKRVVFEKSIDKDGNPVVIEDKPPSFLDTLKVSFKPMVVMLYDPTVNLLTAYNTVIFACLYFLVGKKAECSGINNNNFDFFLLESYYHRYI